MNMKTLLAFLILNFSLAAMADAGPAAPADSCKNPAPLFGRIVAICGERMITFVGTEKVKILGVRVSKSVFELVHCEHGLRIPLALSTNSEGYTLTSDPEGTHSNYKVFNMWMEFKLKGTDNHGNPLDVECKPYIDTRKNIEYIY